MCLLFITACSNKSKINIPDNALFKNIIVEPNSNNVLLYTVTFETQQPSKCFIKYIRTEPKESIKPLFTDTTALSTKHKITVIGITAQSIYNLTITALLDSANTTLPKYAYRDIKTKELPKLLQVPYNLLSKQENSYNGYILVNQRKEQIKFEKNALRELAILNSDGELCWYLLSKDPISSYNITKNNTIIYSTAKLVRNEDNTIKFSHSNIYEINLKGDTLFKITNIPNFIHHEIMRNDKNEYIAITSEVREVEGGSSKETGKVMLSGEKIIKIDSSKNITWQWSLFDHLDPKIYKAYKKGAGYVGALYGKNVYDWVHANKIFIDNDGNYVLSLRFMSTLLKIDAVTGKLIWNLGYYTEEAVMGDFDLTKQTIFEHQHNPIALANGNYMIFDNGEVRKTSRIIEIQLDTVHKKAALVNEYPLPDKYFTPHLGNITILDNNNWLINAGIPKKIIEVNPKTQTIVKEIESGMCIYTALAIDDLYKTKNKYAASY